MKIETKFDLNQEIYFVINRVIDKKGFIKYGVFKGKIYWLLVIVWDLFKNMLFIAMVK